jgi:hypothetical protein
VKSKPVACSVAGCGKTWPRDPILEVACPKCKAPAGVKCGAYRPSEHKLSAGFSGTNSWGNLERDILADEQGKYGECPLGGCGAASRERGLAA